MSTVACRRGVCVILCSIVFAISGSASAKEQMPSETSKFKVIPLPAVFKQVDDPFRGPDYPGLQKGFLALQFGDVSIHFTAKLQAQIAFWTQNGTLIVNGDAAEEEGFRLRRARFGLGGSITKFFVFDLQFEVIKERGNDANLLDAWVGYERFSFAKFYLGAMKIPFSKSADTSSSYLQFIERPLAVNAMAPFQQVGFAVGGAVWRNRFRYHVGIYNGLQRRLTSLEGYEIGVGADLGNRLSRFVTVARFDLEPLGAMSPMISDLYQVNRFRIGVGGGYFFNDGKQIRVHAVSGNVQMKAYGFSMLVEAIWDRTIPARGANVTQTQTQNIDRLAVYGQLGYVIIKKWLEVAVRVEYLDDNRSVKNEGDTLSITGGINVYFIRQVAKFQLNYIHRLELHGTEIKNNMVLGQVQLAF